MALNDNVLLDLATMKTWLRVTNTDYDAIIEGLMNSVAQKFERYCSRLFKAEERTEVYNGSGIDNIMVKNYPINTITSVSLSSSIPRDFSEALDSGAYEIDELADRETINLIGRRTPKGKNTVQVVYNGGYTSYPSDLELAFKQAVEYFYRTRDRQDIGTDRIAKGDEGYNKVKLGKSGLPLDIEASLEPYVSMSQFNYLGAQAD